MNDVQKVKLRHRFIQDTALQVNVLDDPIFTKRLTLFEKDFKAITKYNNYFYEVKEKYGDNIESFLNDYHSIREAIISSVENSSSFKKFNVSGKINAIVGDLKPIDANKNLYTHDNAINGSNFYLSVDIKKANFQALKWFDPNIVNNAETYEDFIGGYTELNLAKESKRTRQIIFGRLNPKRTISVERHLIRCVYDFLISVGIEEWFSIHVANNDELIFKLKEGLDLTEIKSLLEEKGITPSLIKDNIGVDVKMEFFTLLCYDFNTKFFDKTVSAYVKDIIDGKKEYKSVDLKYMAQIYKLLNNMEIEDDDMVFANESSDYARFLYPLTKI